MLRSLFNTIAVQKELQLYQKEAPAQLFSLKYCKSFKNSDFIERCFSPDTMQFSLQNFCSKKIFLSFNDMFKTIKITKSYSKIFKRDFSLYQITVLFMESHAKTKANKVRNSEGVFRTLTN